MQFFNKTVLLSNIKTLSYFLNNSIISESNCVFGPRIAIKHYTAGDMNVIRIWKTNSLLDYWYDDFKTSNFIGAIDYKTCDNIIKIEYLSINDDENITSYSNFKLDKEDAYDLKKSLINFIKLVATEERKNKIIIDVHQNLRLYKKYYMEEGFVKTNRKCIDNPYWVECELAL
jgi:hypothetical protein